MTIPAVVNWLNGDGAEGSNFVITNLDYPYAINEAKPSGPNGRGKITLPAGLRYLARASVTCDGGKRLGFHESRPLLEFAVQPGVTPKALQFVIHEVPCKVWKPE